MGQRSKHIDIGYFFIKDQIRKEGLSIRYCYTEKMIADFLTKPLQGSLFLKLCNVLIDRASVDSLDIPEMQTPQERVGKNKGVKLPASSVPLNTNPGTKPTYASVLKDGL